MSIFQCTLYRVPNSHYPAQIGTCYIVGDFAHVSLFDAYDASYPETEHRARAYQCQSGDLAVATLGKCGMYHFNAEIVFRVAGDDICRNVHCTCVK